MPISSDADLRVRLEPAERQRDAELVVVVRLGGDRARAAAAQSAARMSFVVVLPVAPVIATTRARARSRTAPRDRRERGVRIVGHERRGGAAGERVLDEVGAAADRDEQVALLDRGASRSARR